MSLADRIHRICSMCILPSYPFIHRCNKLTLNGALHENSIPISSFSQWCSGNNAKSTEYRRSKIKRRERRNTWYGFGWVETFELGFPNEFRSKNVEIASQQPKEKSSREILWKNSENDVGCWDRERPRAKRLTMLKCFCLKRKPNTHTHTRRKRDGIGAVCREVVN